MKSMFFWYWKIVHLVVLVHYSYLHLIPALALFTLISRLIAKDAWLPIYTSGTENSYCYRRIFFIGGCLIAGFLCSLFQLPMGRYVIMHTYWSLFNCGVPRFSRMIGKRPEVFLGPTWSFDLRLTPPGHIQIHQPPRQRQLVNAVFSPSLCLATKKKGKKKKRRRKKEKRREKKERIPRLAREFPEKVAAGSRYVASSSNDLPNQLKRKWEND